jgi:hypothetical protein
VKRQCGGDAGRWWVWVNDIEAAGGGYVCANARPGGEV